MEEMEETYPLDELTPTELNPIDANSFRNIPICGTIETCELVNEYLTTGGPEINQLFLKTSLKNRSNLMNRITTECIDLQKEIDFIIEDRVIKLNKLKEELNLLMKLQEEDGKLLNELDARLNG